MINFRNMAESMWGRGGTHAYRTNTKGAYYYSCAGHGGFIIDGRILNDYQRKQLDKYVTPYEGITFSDASGKVRAFWHEFKKRTTTYLLSWTKAKFPIYVLEEDCAWCLAYMFTPIRLNDNFGHTPEKAMGYARKSFHRWYDETSPEVIARKKANEARANGDSNLITTAWGLDDGQTKVATADGKEHLVSGYKDARDEYGTPWLSLCKNVQSLVDS